MEKDSERKLMDEKENSVKCKYQFLSGNFTVVISLNFSAYFSNLPITPNDGVLKLFLSNAQFRFFNNL